MDTEMNTDLIAGTGANIIGPAMKGKHPIRGSHNVNFGIVGLLLCPRRCIISDFRSEKI